MVDLKIDVELCRQAIDEFDPEKQVNLAVEECAELTVALSHYRRFRVSREFVCREIADVLIITRQLAIMFGEEEVEKAIEEKQNRLRSIVSKVVGLG